MLQHSSKETKCCQRETGSSVSAAWRGTTLSGSASSKSSTLPLFTHRRSQANAMGSAQKMMASSQKTTTCRLKRSKREPIEHFFKTRCLASIIRTCCTRSTIVRTTSFSRRLTHRSNSTLRIWIWLLKDYSQVLRDKTRMVVRMAVLCNTESITTCTRVGTQIRVKA